MNKEISMKNIKKTRLLKDERALRRFNHNINNNINKGREILDDGKKRLFCSEKVPLSVVVDKFFLWAYSKEGDGFWRNIFGNNGNIFFSDYFRFLDEES